MINVLAQTDNKQAEIVAHYELTPSDLGNDEDHWTYTFEDMPEFDEGLPITYTIEEVLPDGSESHYTQTGNTGSVEEGFTITNSHETDKTEITVTKNWDDNNDQDGKRRTVVVSLFADGINTGKTGELTEANKYTYTFDKLEKFKKENNEGGVEIKYTVEELEENNTELFKDYELVGISQDEETGLFTITNKHEIEKTTVSGEKAWDFSQNTYGFDTPKQIKVILTKNGKDIAEQIVEEDENHKWKYEFKDLDKYENKELIQYYVREEEIIDFTTEITPVSEYVFNIKNTYTPETAPINGTKFWDDEDDQDGVRPTSIEIYLIAQVLNDETGEYEDVYKDKEPRVVNGPEEGANEATEWSYSFDGLPVYANGKEIRWVAEEVLPDGYTRIEENITLDMTNVHTPEKISYTVKKIWEEEDQNDRPESIIFYLWDDVSTEPIAEAEAFESDNWSVTFDNLPKYRDHRTPIKYTITENIVKGYSEPIIEETGEYESTVTNVQLVKIHIVKTWNDKNNEYNLRPDHIIVDIFGDGELIESVTITENDNWEYIFTGLPKYNKDMEEIIYTIKEQPVAKYITSYNKYNIENLLNETEIEIIPPDTNTNSEGNNIGIIYMITALLSLIAVGFKKIYE